MLETAQIERLRISLPDMMELQGASIHGVDVVYTNDGECISFSVGTGEVALLIHAAHGSSRKAIVRVLENALSVRFEEL